MATPLRCPLSSLLVGAVLFLGGCDVTPYREVRVDLASRPSDGSPAAGERPRKLRFSVAAIESPRDTYAVYSRLFERMGQRLGVEIDFVQRRTYKEVNEMLAGGRLDAALLCTGGYLDLVNRAPGAVELLAVPVVDGDSTYRSLIIVPARSSAARIEDLAGKRFAFTDELSFSGRLYVFDLLKQMGRDPKTFFGRPTFSGSHDRSVTAVAKAMVDGAAVHSLIYEQLVARDPSLGAATRVIHRSPEFGMMPIVASAALDPAVRARLRAVLLDLANDPEGAASLATLHIERFDTPAPDLFRAAAAVVQGAR